MLCPLMRVWKRFRIQVSSSLSKRWRNFCTLCLLSIARNSRMNVVLLEESFKPRTDFQVSIDILIYVILDAYEFIFLIPLRANSVSSTSFPILKCLCIPHSTQRSLRTFVLLHLCQIRKDLQVIEREEFFWIFLYREKYLYKEKPR